MTSTNWKNKYLTALDQQEKTERQYKQILSLLTRAVIRISMVAEGVDRRLDKQLVGMRALLRDGTPSRRDLDTLVEALEGQVKRLETVKTERAKAISDSFNALSKQLKTLSPNKESAKELKQFSKSLKKRSGQLYEVPTLLSDYTGLQQAILAASDGPQQQGSLLSRLLNRSGDSAKQAADAPPETTESEPVPDLADDTSDSITAPITIATEDPAADGDVESEPPFSKFNKAICAIIAELLQQIEPPKTAKDNYRRVEQSIAKGLNWYELVSVLEDVSIIVICAIDRDQKEFEQFLKELNQRLTEAYEFIDASQQSHNAGRNAGKQLSASVREQVSAMQQSLDTATGLDHLKSEVTSRLDQIVSAMDKHQSEEQDRDQTLSGQLNELVERVKTMEGESAQAEARIEEQRQRALRDVLTQLPNREAYQQRLAQEFERWQRYDRPLALVVTDIDHFKRINDGYGHLAGDKVLRIIAKTLAKRLRKTDFIARFGGEEFVILMPETSQQQALGVVDKIREAIGECPFHFKEKPVTITLSFGITEFNEGDTTEQAFERADTALYKAKEEGRNRCCVG